MIEEGSSQQEDRAAFRREIFRAAFEERRRIVRKVRCPAHGNALDLELDQTSAEPRMRLISCCPVGERLAMEAVE